jgi:uncharacterized protein with PQ loop repeat
LHNSPWIHKSSCVNSQNNPWPQNCSCSFWWCWGCCTMAWIHSYSLFTLSTFASQVKIVFRYKSLYHCPLLMVISTGLKILCWFLYGEYINHIYLSTSFFYPPSPITDLLLAWAVFYNTACICIGPCHHLDLTLFYVILNAMFHFHIPRCQLWSEYDHFHSCGLFSVSCERGNCVHDVRWAMSCTWVLRCYLQGNIQCSALCSGSCVLNMHKGYKGVWQCA